MRNKFRGAALLLCAVLLYAPLLTPSARAQSATKTHVVDYLHDAAGNPLTGKVTFILTQKSATSPDGLVVSSPTVSATLDNTGKFDVYLYPSASLSPASYYQVYVTSGVGNQTLIGVYNIPASGTVITLGPNKVTDTNLAAQYTFASLPSITALEGTISSHVYASFFAASSNGKVQKYNAGATGLADSSIDDSGATLAVGKGVNVSGAVTATNFIGNGAGLTGITGATGGISNTGSTTIRHDSDNDGVGVTDIQGKNGHTGLRVENDGTVTLFGPLDGTNLSTVISSFGSTPTVLSVRTAQTVSADLTVPSTVVIEIEGPGSFNVANGKTLTIQGPVALPERQVFYNIGTGLGAVSFSGNTSLKSVSAAWWSGDIGQKITAAKNSLPSQGGVIDARSITGEQSLSGNLTLDKNNTTVLFGNTSVTMGANQVVFSPGTRAVQITGQGPFGSSKAAAHAGTAFFYSGTDWAFKVGDNSTQTFFPRISDIGLYVNSSAGNGILYYNTVQGILERPMLIADAGNTGVAVAFNGYDSLTRFSALNRVVQPYLTNFKRLFVVSTASGNGSANQNVVEGGVLTGPGAAVSGSICADIGAGTTNGVIGTYLENCETAIHVGGGAILNLSRGFTLDTVGTGITIDAGAMNNVFTDFLDIGPYPLTNNSGNATNTILDTTKTMTLGWSSSLGSYVQPATGQPLNIYSGNGTKKIAVLDARTTLTGQVNLNGLPTYANNAAALAGGLSVGDLYRNGDVVQIVH